MNQRLPKGVFLRKFREKLGDKMKKFKILIIATASTIIITGCEKPVPELPEVNDENCKMKNVEKLDKRIIVEFNSLCASRPIYKPVKRKKW